ncbi:hypothetical protein LOC68_25025 [Blastopirellula sp. JC732]|uniref:Uncharacterized protein n=1 Tax=Blastopirellula sediminis TaxID=2894196 RepID=A0A9X1MQU4_9BACT|nr:hypothetical protein [Blastopirellula sediminis]MCC9605027.1 hypothetical protein [Blastopirellula sediminis]MCC9631673.1 hypothetical protein [Blastopirellula sediminis]
MNRVRVPLHALLWIGLAIGLFFWIEASLRLRVAQAYKTRIVDYYRLGDNRQSPREIDYASLRWDKYQAQLYRIHRVAPDAVLQIQCLYSLQNARFSSENIVLSPQNDYEFKILKENAAANLVLLIPGRNRNTRDFTSEVQHFLNNYHDQFEFQMINADGEFPTDDRQIQTILQWVPSPELLAEHPEFPADLPVFRIRLGTVQAFKAEGSFDYFLWTSPPNRPPLRETPQGASPFGGDAPKPSASKGGTP